MAGTLEPALDTSLQYCERRSGRLAYYVGGDGPPVLLVHSINAAASAYEMKPVFEFLTSRYRVYVPDLPGFGHSNRSPRTYDVPLYVNSVHDMLDEIGNEHSDAPIQAVGLSLGCEFLVRAARDHPDRFRSVALIVPTGFMRGSETLREPEGSTRKMAIASGIASIPGFNRGLFRLLVRPGVIRYFLKRSCGTESIDEQLADYDVQTASQPGAHHAPLAFISGALFSADIRNVYEALDLPVWLAKATRGDFRDFSEARWTEDRDNWQSEAFDSGALPQFETPDVFLGRLGEFMERHR